MEKVRAESISMKDWPSDWTLVNIPVVDETWRYCQMCEEEEEEDLADALETKRKYERGHFLVAASGKNLMPSPRVSEV